MRGDPTPTPDGAPEPGSLLRTPDGDVWRLRYYTNDLSWDDPRNPTEVVRGRWDVLGSNGGLHGYVGVAPDDAVLIWPIASDVEAACEVMHDAYEAAVVGAGWETQQASRVPWADVPEANKATMRAAVSALIAWMR